MTIDRIPFLPVSLG